MNLESIKEGDVIIVTEEGRSWAERVTETTPKRVRTQPPECYDISSISEYDRSTGKMRDSLSSWGSKYVARSPDAEDDLLVLQLEMSEQDWGSVPVETLRKIRELLA
jgi:hypothetical protein